MKHFTVFLFLLIGTAYSANAQFSRYVIQLNNKAGTPFSIGNPTSFLSARSISRKTRYQIPIDSTDLPLTPRYLDSIRTAGVVKIISVSRWFNQVCIQTSDAATLIKINAFPFVASVKALAARSSQYQFPIFNKITDTFSDPIPSNHRPANPTDYFNYGLSYGQVHLHNGEFLHNHGFRGEGMQMAILDAGFFTYTTSRIYDSARTNNQILGTWDYVLGAAGVDGYASHGQQCFSTIAANIPGSFVGTAPKAGYYLFRTEDGATEYPIEEFNWLAGAERADSAGVDVISVSLGYNIFSNASFNYTYADMTGNKTLITRAVNRAVFKGMSVVAAAGNEGSSAWRYITAPGDADSVITVGAVATTRQVASFSSFGPNADGQIKPDVAAVGANAVVANNNGQPSFGGGTSYACPIMAGLTTCLWQAFPEVNNLKIIDVLHRSADRFNNPDDRSGYGIPDMKKAFVLLQKYLYQQQINLSNCKATVGGNIKADASMLLFVERKVGSNGTFEPWKTVLFSGSFAAQPFSLTDSLTGLTPPTAIEYRLGMTIGTDTTYYLDSATVDYNAICTTPLPPVVEDDILIGPNPVTDQLQVSITRNQPVTVALVMHNSIGQKVFEQTNIPVTGTRKILIPMQSFQKGFYHLSVYINQQRVLLKTIVR